MSEQRFSGSRTDLYELHGSVTVTQRGDLSTQTSFSSTRGILPTMPCRRHAVVWRPFGDTDPSKSERTSGVFRFREDLEEPCQLVLTLVPEPPGRSNMEN